MRYRGAGRRRGCPSRGLRSLLLDPPDRGTGVYSREFKRRGATDVFGVDISVEMIAAAREIERRDPLGTRYEVGDVEELRPFERRFDIALGVQCLNYAELKTQKTRACVEGAEPGGDGGRGGSARSCRLDREARRGTGSSAPPGPRSSDERRRGLTHPSPAWRRPAPRGRPVRPAAPRRQAAGRAWIRSPPGRYQASGRRPSP